MKCNNTGVEAIKSRMNALIKGMVGLKGHRSVGGFRASIYNAMPIESVKALIDCMQEFEKIK